MTTDWQKYEILKKEIYNKNLTPEEYEAEIRKVLKEIEVENVDTI